jgi:RNA polymerase sigma-70 factor (ECF subfamily)
MLFFYLAVLETDEERDTLASWYHKYKKELMRIALKRLRRSELAEDAVHETFMEAIRHKEHIISKSPIDFLRWSVIVIERKCIDILRRRTHIDGGISLNDEKVCEFPDNGEPLDILLTQRDDYEKIMDCLPEIGMENKQILWMKYVLGMSYSEIALKTGLSPEQLSNRMARTKTRLRILFERRGGIR